MRILVAGGAGFIGSHLCEQLLIAEHDVICIDNFVTGRIGNIDNIISHPRFQLVEWDVVQPWATREQIDRVYHLASPASPIGYMRNPIDTHLVNSIGTLNLLRLAVEHDAKFLFASTSEAYGDPLVHPQTEDYLGNVNPVGPRSCYDESKRFGESITMEFVRGKDLDARILRIFNTYGPKSDPVDGRIIPAFIMNALQDLPLLVYGDGQQTRSLCYVDDLVQGIMRAMEYDDTTGEVINLGNPFEQSVIEIAEMIITMCQSKSTVTFSAARPDDPYRRCPDITKARRLLDWEPVVSLDKGLQETISYLSSYVQYSHTSATYE